MDKQYIVGQPVKYIDSYGKAHDALITVWWFGENLIPDYLSAHGEPGCNLLYVTADSMKRDSYGQQVERETSVVHKSKQAATGRYWCWPDEL